MNKTFNTTLLLLLSLVMTIGMFSSCDKNNDDINSGKIELLSFGPTGAKHGDTIRFIGNNLNQVTSILLTGATVDKAAFIQHTPELITIKVPNSTVQGFVTLKTPTGDIVSKTQFNLEVPVKITSVTAEARPGENITIKGDFLNWVNSITFGLNKVVTTFVSKTLTELVVKVPMDAQTDKLTLSTGGTEPLTIITDNAFIVTLPAVTDMASNPVKHADNLTITGTNLDLVAGVIFNGVTAAVTSFVSQSATQIVVKVPGGAKDGKLTLKALSGVTVQSANNLNLVWPTATALSPNPMDPETDLTITGTNLDLVTGISFTGVPAVTSFVSQSPTQIVVKAPAGALKGKLVFSVLNSTLTVESSQVLAFNGGLPPLADFALAFYTDALQNGFQDWSWATRDFNSTANVRQGDKSIKATYGSGGYEGITFHNNTAVNTSAYTKLEFSVFAEPGIGTGKKLNVVYNGANWGAPYQVTLIPGEWTTFTVNLSSLGSPATLSEIVLQSAGWSGVIHIDHVGLR